MEEIFDQIIGTYDAGFPYAALMLALSIPDICSNLSVSDDANTSAQKSRYIRWYGENVEENPLTAEDCYSLRCGIMHKGVLGNKHQQFERVVFHIGFTIDTMMENPTFNGKKYEGRILIISAQGFINRLIKAARNWLSTFENKRLLESNMSRLLKYYPDGYPLNRDVMLLGGAACVA